MSIEARFHARRREGALIGPNAVLQAVAVMEQRLGVAETQAILADAQIARLPSGAHMIPEIEALRLHRWLALHDPMGCFVIAEEAGARTADYIIANRIRARRLLAAAPPACRPCRPGVDGSDQEARLDFHRRRGLHHRRGLGLHDRPLGRGRHHHAA
ncbi:hypothetical protein CHX26_04415 [Porphyrobacter sp. HT-58-2]|uniref:hypothetical protein n=1 Tax=Porphyrobacter sp. HT-58-2 TaxID=2023229 RepID=UPI000CDCC5C7|nr:hypothetical protein [Porphyrobacter sp. HT-58-2]AUX68853.1 hypothetical protein CHX26_04415 [Porphyrobacter sp. HT-58-2]